MEEKKGEVRLLSSRVQPARDSYVISPVTVRRNDTIDFSEAIIDDHITFAKIANLVNGAADAKAWH